jgi:hypothetical protein
MKKKDTSGWKWVPNNHINFRFKRTSWRNVSLRKHRDEMCHWENIVTKCVTEKTSWRNVSLRKHRDEMCHWENIVTKCVTAKTSWRNVSLRKTFEFFLNFNCYVSVWGSLNNDSPDFSNSLKIELYLPNNLH